MAEPATEDPQPGERSPSPPRRSSQLRRPGSSDVAASGGSRPRKWSSQLGDRYQLWLTLCCLVAFGVYAATSIVKYNQFRSGMDLTIFDQAVRSFSHFQPGYTTMKAPGMSIFGDHFHPILLIMVPLYWIWSDPRMLLVAQAACAALAGWLLGRLAGRRLGPATGLILVIGYLASIGIQAGIVFDFHEVALGLPLLAMALTSFLEQRWQACWIWSATLMLIKEDTCFLVAGVALAMFLRGRRVRAVTLLAVAGAWTAAAVFVIIPHFNPDHAYPYLGSLGSVTVSGVEIGVHPWWQGPVWTLGTTLLLLAGTGFAAAASPLIWAVLIPMATRAVSKNPQHWVPSFHYQMLTSVVLFFAVVDAWPRIKARWRRPVLGVIILVAALSAAFGHISHEWRIGACTESCQNAPTALATVPDHARVAADVYLTSHLSPRTDVSQWRPPDFTDDLGQPVNVDWLVLNRDTIAYDNKTNHWVDAWLASGRLGWTITGEYGPIVVLRHN